MKEIHLYCCSSYYQVYVSFIRALALNETIELVLELHGVETAYELAKVIENEASSFVNKVYVCEDSSKVDPYTEHFALGIPWKRKEIKNHMEKVFGNPFNPDTYKEIHVFWDLGYAGTYFNSRKIPYTLHEDSLNSYQHIRENRGNYAYIWNPKRPAFWVREKLGLGVIPFGFSKYCNKVIVNDKTNIQIPMDKVEEVSIATLEQRLTQIHKQKIFDIFVEEKEDVKITNQVLLLTEPFFVTRRLSSEEQQIALYRHIIKTYAKNQKIIIKAHPRDDVDYKKYFENISVMEKNVPIEVLNFSETFQVDKAITVTSSAIYGIKCAKESVYLGPDFLKEFQ